MSNKLQLTVIQAIKTFTSLKANLNIKDDVNFKTLTSLVNELSFVDVKLPARLFSQEHTNLQSTNNVEYIEVHEDNNVSIGIFIIRKGAKIPLHDHPGMYGLLKVLHGELEIVSYNLPESSQLPKGSGTLYYNKPLEVTRNIAKVLKSKDPCSVLEPVISNIHEVKCLVGPAAFLDILSPPYGKEMHDSAARSCHYFREEGSSDGKSYRLVQIPCPQDFWTE